jgi:SAM-dependent methyltransferase
MSILEAAEQYRLDGGRSTFDLLRHKWRTVPGGLMERTQSDLLLGLCDRELRDYWEGAWADASMGPAFSVRGWYHRLYADVFRGRRVLEIGSGMGIDGVHFIRNGAIWHFADIVQSNLVLIDRILTAFDLSCESTTWIEDFASFDQIPEGFDFIYCQGSLINVPFHFARAETLRIVPKLKPGGRWIELCYPKDRWAREGRLPFSTWGEVTHGEATPWMEWYDLERLQQRFSPIQVRPVINFNFHQNDFNWFDLAIDHVPSAKVAQRFTELPASGTLPKLISLEDYPAHNAAKVEKDDSSGCISVTANPAQWSYGLQYPLADAIEELCADKFSHAEAVALSVLVDMQVHSGAIGVGVLDNALREYLSPEVNVEAADESCTLAIPVPLGRGQVHLMFRNIAGGHACSRFCVSKISMQWTAPRSTAETRDWSDVAPTLSLTSLVRRHWSLIARDNAMSKNFEPPTIPAFVRAVDVDDLGPLLGYAAPFEAAAFNKNKGYLDWRMEGDDSQILAYLYRNHQPHRHFEFGTWEGFGAALCAESCNAEIWTLNLPAGERTSAGDPVYRREVTEHDELPRGIDLGDNTRTVQTDAGNWIGWRYRAAGYGNRVRQILADSTMWDSSSIVDGYFDSILVDGGHSTTHQLFHRQ